MLRIAHCRRRRRCRNVTRSVNLEGNYDRTVSDAGGGWVVRHLDRRDMGIG